MPDGDRLPVTIGHHHFHSRSTQPPGTSTLSIANSNFHNQFNRFAASGADLPIRPNLESDAGHQEPRISWHVVRDMTKQNGGLTD
jgi:hypothetical protein